MGWFDGGGVNRVSVNGAAVGGETLLVQYCGGDALAMSRCSFVERRVDGRHLEPRLG